MVHPAKRDWLFFKTKSKAFAILNVNIYFYYISILRNKYDFHMCSGQQWDALKKVFQDLQGLFRIRVFIEKLTFIDHNYHFH